MKQDLKWLEGVAIEVTEEQTGGDIIEYFEMFGAKPEYLKLQDVPEHYLGVDSGIVKWYITTDRNVINIPKFPREMMVRNFKYEGWETHKVYAYDECSFITIDGAYKEAKEIFEPKTKYVPFTYDDMELFMGKWVKAKNSHEYELISAFDEKYISLNEDWYTYKYVFNKYEFIDGKPFGKEVENV